VTLTDLHTLSLASNNTPHTHFDSLHQLLLFPFDLTVSKQVSVFAAKKKYKLVALKTRPLLAYLPDKFRIICNITGDPLTNIPILTPTLPPFTPTGHYTAKNHNCINKVHLGNFLWPAKHDLMHHFMCLQNQGFVWNNTECGCFHKDFFLPVLMTIVEHKPWVLWNMPILPRLYNEICKTTKTKIEVGVYKWSTHLISHAGLQSSRKTVKHFDSFTVWNHWMQSPSNILEYHHS